MNDGVGLLLLTDGAELYSGLILTAAGTAKLLDDSAVRLTLRSLGISQAALAARTLAGLECFLGASLCSGAGVRVTVPAASVLFLVLVTSRLSLSTAWAECGCFGGLARGVPRVVVEIATLSPAVLLPLAVLVNGVSRTGPSGLRATVGVTMMVVCIVLVTRKNFGEARALRAAWTDD